MDRFSGMTGEPNQQNPSSVFGFDPYPPPYTVSWAQSDPFANSSQPGPSFQQPHTILEGPLSPFTVPTLQPSQINVPNMASQFSMPLPQPQTNYTFGASKPSQEVVQFPFEVANHGFGHRVIHQAMRCKRKTDSPPLQPSKQHITEEKMAEHMSKLHISSETATSSKESESDKTQRLYMCEEMRKLQTDSILPQSLLSRIQRPCTALVLWKPPTRLLPVSIANQRLDENDNNNEERAPDHNVIENEQEMENVSDVIANNMDMDN